MLLPRRYLHEHDTNIEILYIGYYHLYERKGLFLDLLHLQQDHEDPE